MNIFQYSHLLRDLYSLPQFNLQVVHLFFLYCSHRSSYQLQSTFGEEGKINERSEELREILEHLNGSVIVFLFHLHKAGVHPTADTFVKEINKFCKYLTLL